MNCLINKNFTRRLDETESMKVWLILIRKDEIVMDILQWFAQIDLDTLAVIGKNTVDLVGRSNLAIKRSCFEGLNCMLCRHTFWAGLIGLILLCCNCIRSSSSTCIGSLRAFFANCRRGNLYQWKGFVSLRNVLLILNDMGVSSMNFGRLLPSAAKFQKTKFQCFYKYLKHKNTKCSKFVYLCGFVARLVMVQGVVNGKKLVLVDCITGIDWW